MLTKWPAAPVEHRRQELPDGPDDGEEVDVEDPSPGVDRDLGRLSHHQDAHVAHDQIDGTIGGERRLVEGRHVAVFRHVAALSDGPASPVDDAGQAGGQALLVDVGEDHPGARLGQGDRGRAADAARRTRHHGDASRKVGDHGTASASSAWILAHDSPTTWSRNDALGHPAYAAKWRTSSRISARETSRLLRAE